MDNDMVPDMFVLLSKTYELDIHGSCCCMGGCPLICVQWSDFLLIRNISLFVVIDI